MKILPFLIIFALLATPIPVNASTYGKVYTIPDSYFIYETTTLNDYAYSSNSTVDRTLDISTHNGTGAKAIFDLKDYTSGCGDGPETAKFSYENDDYVQFHITKNGTDHEAKISWDITGYSTGETAPILVDLTNLVTFYWYNNNGTVTWHIDDTETTLDDNAVDSDLIGLKFTKHNTKIQCSSMNEGGKIYIHAYLYDNLTSTQYLNNQINDILPILLTAMILIVIIKKL